MVSPGAEVPDFADSFVDKKQLFTVACLALIFSVFLFSRVQPMYTLEETFAASFIPTTITTIVNKTDSGGEGKGDMPFIYF